MAEKDSHKNKFSEFAKTLAESIAAAIEESRENIEKQTALANKVGHMKALEEKGEYLEKFALHNAEDGLYLKVVILRDSKTHKVKEVYPMLQSEEDYHTDNELDFVAGCELHSAEIQTRCPHCGEHNVTGEKSDNWEPPQEEGEQL